MATYTSNKRGAAPSGHGFGGNVKVMTGEVAVPSTLTGADVLEFFSLPAGATVLFATLAATDIDTDGTPAVTINVGDASSGTRFFSASTVGQTGTVAVSSSATGIFHTYAEETLITGALGTDPDVGAAGTITLAIGYTMP